MKKIVITQEFKKDTLKIADAIREGVRLAFYANRTASHSTAQSIYGAINESRLDNIREAIQYLGEDDCQSFTTKEMNKPSRKEMKRYARRLLSQLSKLANEDDRNGKEAMEPYNASGDKDIVTEAKAAVENADLNLNHYCPVNQPVRAVREVYTPVTIENDKIVHGTPSECKKEYPTLLEDAKLNIANTVHDVGAAAGRFFRSLNPFAK